MAAQVFKAPAQWETKIVKSLPKELKGSLPSIEAWERELGYGG